MNKVQLIEIRKFKWQCINPYCRRWNEESFPEKSKVICSFCGEIFGTVSHNHIESSETFNDAWNEQRDI